MKRSYLLNKTSNEGCPFVYVYVLVDARRYMVNEIAHKNCANFVIVSLILLNARTICLINKQLKI